jgi:hypothetical protein
MWVSTALHHYFSSPRPTLTPVPAPTPSPAPVPTPVPLTHYPQVSFLDYFVFMINCRFSEAGQEHVYFTGVRK